MPKPVRSSIHQSLSATLLLAISGAACTDDSGMMMNPPDTTDTEAPSVAETIPAIGATGVAADAKIHITFSEPMDPGTIEDAYDSPQLPLDKVGLEWTPDMQVLTITPSAPLYYAESTGTDLSVAERYTYTITIGTEAADLAGNRLTAPLQLSFATKRRLTAKFDYDPDLTKSLREESVLGGADLLVGDSADGDRYHSYVTFDLSALPAASEIEAASFKGTQQTTVGMPYSSLGPLKVQHLTFATMDNISSVPAISLPGTLSEDGNVEEKVIEVTSQVRDDAANRAARNNRSQYRVQFDTATDGDAVSDAAVFTTSTFEMTVTYVVD